MFNDNASDQDRQKKLEELIRKNNDDGDDSEDKNAESEIPTFEMINEMLARSPEELELFNKMDAEMGVRENRTAKMEEIMKHRPGVTMESQVNYRLTQEWEVPDWIRVKPVDEDLEKD